MNWSESTKVLKLQLGPWTIRVRRSDTVPEIEWWIWEANTGEQLAGFKSERAARDSAEEWLRDELKGLLAELDGAK